MTPGRRGCSTERSTGCQKGKGSLDCAHCLFLLPHFPPRLYLECPLIATVPRSGAYALPNAAAFLTCVLAGGDLWVEVTRDASDAPAGGGSGGGRALSSLGMPTVRELRGVLADEGRGARVAQGLLCVCSVGSGNSGRKTDDGRKCQLPSQADGLCCFHLACIAIFSKSPGGLSESHTGDLKAACGNFRIHLMEVSQSQLKL